MQKIAALIVSICLFWGVESALAITKKEVREILSAPGYEIYLPKKRSKKLLEDFLGKPKKCFLGFSVKDGVITHASFAALNSGI